MNDLKAIAERETLGYWDGVKVETLKGETIASMYVHTQGSQDAIVFETTEGDVYKMSHYQDCCESVCLETESIPTLINAKVIEFSERIVEKDTEWGSMTATFYCLKTDKGTLDLAWRGESNGYYSERVDFYLVAGPKFEAIKLEREKSGKR